MSEPDNAADPDIAAESSAVSPEAQPAQEETAVGFPAALPEHIPHAGPRYAVLRLVVLVAVGGVLYVIGIRGWDLAFVAVLVSGILSLFLFSLNPPSGSLIVWAELS